MCEKDDAKVGESVRYKTLVDGKEVPTRAERMITELRGTEGQLLTILAQVKCCIRLLQEQPECAGAIQTGMQLVRLDQFADLRKVLFAENR